MPSVLGRSATEARTRSSIDPNSGHSWAWCRSRTSPRDSVSEPALDSGQPSRCAVRRQTGEDHELAVVSLHGGARASLASAASTSGLSSSAVRTPSAWCAGTLITASRVRSGWVLSRMQGSDGRSHRNGGPATDRLPRCG